MTQHRKAGFGFWLTVTLLLFSGGPFEDPFNAADVVIDHHLGQTLPDYVLL